MIGDRIKERREKLNMSQDELAQRLGYKSRSSINKMELGIQDVPQRKMRKLASILGVEIGYLMEDDKKEKNPFSKFNLVSVPIYSCLSCGLGTWIDEVPDEFIGVPDYMMFSGRGFANPAEGDSMEPSICSGDLLIFEETPEVDSGKIGSFRLNGKYYCKRFKRLADGSMWLFSDNPQYDPIPIKPEDDFKTLGLYKLKLSKEQ